MANSLSPITECMVSCPDTQCLQYDKVTRVLAELMHNFDVVTRETQAEADELVESCYIINKYTVTEY